jgi:hypothetical protein
LLQEIQQLRQMQDKLSQHLKDLECQIKLIESQAKDKRFNNSVLIGAIDQGTTSSRFLIFNARGEIVAAHQKEFKQIHPNPGYEAINI